jgi:hypothetical protein
MGQHQGQHQEQQQQQQQQQSFDCSLLPYQVHEPIVLLSISFHSVDQQGLWRGSNMVVAYCL